MPKLFTVDDVQEVTKAAEMMGVEAVWCNILFKGCKNPVEFQASPHIGDAFSRDMYERLKGGQFGPLHHGFGEWYFTMPKSQQEVEEAVIAKRNQLLLESDFADLPVTQARLSDSQKAAWAEYRQSLRDLTSQVGFPWDPEWPVKP
jgi:hypothetical protein